MYVPRFRGNAVQQGSSWKWELMISVGPVGPGYPEPIWIHSKPDFINRESALKDMGSKMPELMVEVCKAMNLPAPDGVHDLNEGVLKSFEEFKK